MKNYIRKCWQKSLKVALKLMNWEGKWVEKAEGTGGSWREGQGKGRGGGGEGEGDYLEQYLKAHFQLLACHWKNSSKFQKLKNKFKVMYSG